MSGGLVFVGVLALADLVLTLLVARRVLQIERVAGPARRPWLPPGTKVPDFDTVTIGGERVTLEGLRGRPSLIGLFSPGCAPCREEAPAFARHAGAAAGPGQALAVVIGPSGDDAAELMALLDGKLPVAREERSGPVATALSARGFPAIYRLDPQGKVVASGASVTAVCGRRADDAASALG
jgi:thiol-disulfide isomerase/thioredoxin